VADDLLSDDLEERAPTPKKRKLDPGIVRRAFTALRDWATGYRLLVIGVVILVAHFLYYNADPILIDLWGVLVRIPKVLAFILFGLIGALIAILLLEPEQLRWPWGAESAGDELEEG
jgi:uncharacterized integral membrane protein